MMETTGNKMGKYKKKTWEVHLVTKFYGERHISKNEIKHKRHQAKHW